MKKKVFEIIGIAMFIGVMAFNISLNGKSSKINSQITLAEVATECNGDVDCEEGYNARRIDATYYDCCDKHDGSLTGHHSKSYTQ
ncbi:MAG: hypothetical protein ACQERU_09500 [Bacteroidota bacterium]